jgi:molecular chaperone DnaK
MRSRRCGKDAESHAEEDKKRREEVEARNKADNAVYTTEKMLKENGDKLKGEDKSKIESALNGVKEALKGSDGAAIESALSKLNEVQQAIWAEVYKQASQARGGAGGAGPEPGPGPQPGGGAGGTRRNPAGAKAEPRRKGRSSTRRLWTRTSANLK